jgi:hypothetical protein
MESCSLTVVLIEPAPEPGAAEKMGDAEGMSVPAGTMIGVDSVLVALLQADPGSHPVGLVVVISVASGGRE